MHLGHPGLTQLRACSILLLEADFVPVNVAVMTPTMRLISFSMRTFILETKFYANGLIARVYNLQTFYSSKVCMELVHPFVSYQSFTGLSAEETREFWVNRYSVDKTEFKIARYAAPQKLKYTQISVPSIFSGRVSTINNALLWLNLVPALILLTPLSRNGIE